MNASLEAAKEVAEKDAEIIEMATQKKVARFVGHIHPHLDDILDKVIVTIYGSDRYGDCDNAVVDLVSRDNGYHDKDDAWFADRGLVPLGIGKTEANEHGENGRKVGEDRKLESSSHMRAKLLGVDKLPEIVSLVDSTRWYDNHTGCPPTHLAAIVKAWYWRDSESSQYVLSMVTMFIEALIMEKRFSLPAKAMERTLADIFAGMKAQGRFTDTEALAWTEKRIGESMSRQDHQAELACVVRALYRRGYDDATVLGHIVPIIDNLYLQQVDFQNILREVSQHKPLYIFTGNGAEPLKAYALPATDHPRAHQACINCSADIVLIRRSSGNVQVFTNRKARVSLSNVVKMIRWLAMPVNRKPRTYKEWLKLSVPESMEETPQWFYYKEGEALFNGSYTHYADPTEISFDFLVSIIQHAFSVDGVRKWCKHVGIDWDGQAEDREYIAQCRRRVEREIASVQEAKLQTKPAEESLCDEVVRLGKELDRDVSLSS